MQKHKENLFLEKFSLLNSQDNTEDIKWSSSSSSNYENTSCNEKINNSKTISRKRKRKKKTPKNVSNLDIMIIDGSKDHIRDSHREKSPILVTKCVETPTSPILTSTRFPPNKISHKLSMSMKSLQQRSPILMSKNVSPKYTSKVKKKLAYNNEQKSMREREFNSNEKTRETLDSNFKTVDSGKENASQVDNNLNIAMRNKIEEDYNLKVSSPENKSDILNSLKSAESGSSLKAKLKLVNHVKNYFDSHFSSENTSQNISDTPTPEEHIKNETIDILTCRTQTASTIQTVFKQDSTSNSDTSNFFEKNKKVKYKKGGLANRLNVLLKKQNAHVSLWQHERFLAGTSNCVIPKGEHVVFCIQKIDFKYGCYLLDTVDVNNEKYVVFINSVNVNNNITVDSVLKLYEPYRILKMDDKDYKIIINVCKFECFDLNNR